MFMLTLLIELCEVLYEVSFQAWGCPCTPRNIQEVQASKLGDAPEAPPFFIDKKIRSPFKTLYFYCFMYYAFFLEHQLYLLSVFLFALLAAINGWITSCWFGWRHTSFFIAKNTLVFTLIVQ
jgi:hypothetical protein